MTRTCLILFAFLVFVGVSVATAQQPSGNPAYELSAYALAPPASFFEQLAAGDMMFTHYRIRRTDSKPFIVYSYTILNPRIETGEVGEPVRFGGLVAERRSSEFILGLSIHFSHSEPTWSASYYAYSGDQLYIGDGIGGLPFGPDGQIFFPDPRPGTTLTEDQPYLLFASPYPDDPGGPPLFEFYIAARLEPIDEMPE